MVEIKFKGVIRKWSNSFIVTVPMSFISNDLLKEGETYEFVARKIVSKKAVKIRCLDCKGYEENPSDKSVFDVENGMTCGCGGKLEVIYDDAEL